MTILLAIIAINLYSIGSSLNTEKEINRQKLICIKYEKGHIPIMKLGDKLKRSSKPRVGYPSSSPGEICRSILAS